MRKFQGYIVFVLVGLGIVNLSCGTAPVAEDGMIKSTTRSSSDRSSTHQSFLRELDCSGIRPGTTGTLVADTGFRPNPHGFSFPNYRDDYPDGDLTIQEMRQLFGDQVCKSLQDGTCVPTTPAYIWMKNMNLAMQTGHCEGMAALSAWFFHDAQTLQEYGQPIPFALTPAQVAVLRSIAYYWTMQTLEPVISEFVEFLQKTPTEILETLLEAMQSDSEYYTLGVYGDLGGHAVTPYAIEEVGNGVFWVYVYDNNFPCAYKYVEIDTTRDSWRYAGAAIHPEQDPRPWEGGTGTLDLTSLSVRQRPMECPFCEDPQTGCDVENKGLAIVLTGKGSALSARNQAGQTIRIENGQLVNQIPGATLFRLKGPYAGDLSTARGALVILPPDEEYTVDITGEHNESPEDTQVAVIQPCKGFAVTGIALDPQQQDQLIIEKGRRIRYRSDDREQPRLEVAVYDPDGSDGWYEVSDIDLQPDASFDIDVDPETGEIFFSDDDPELDSFDVEVIIVDEQGEFEAFWYDDVDPGDEGQAIGEIGEDGEFELARDADSDGLIDAVDRDDDDDGLPDDEDFDDDGDGLPDDEDVDDDEFFKEEIDDDLEAEDWLEDEEDDDMVPEDMEADPFEAEDFSDDEADFEEEPEDVDEADFEDGSETGFEEESEDADEADFEDGSEADVEDESSDDDSGDEGGDDY